MSFKFGGTMKKRFVLPMFLFVIALFCSQHAMAEGCTNSAFFHNTVWKSYNLETKFIRYFFFKKDGTVGFSKTPGNFKYDGTDTWKVEDGFLVLVWSNGFAMEKYPINRKSCDILNGKKTSKKWRGEKDVRLSRIAN
jgi:hypothetical protein